ncbi:hypothetical protein [Pseudenhygromyxa sp. WMMC2535]|nr:hypothetical protein [Pseudenhygromyxa sp. WMMC2535]
MSAPPWLADVERDRLEGFDVGRSFAAAAAKAIPAGQLELDFAA